LWEVSRDWHRETRYKPTFVTNPNSYSYPLLVRDLRAVVGLSERLISLRNALE